MFRFLFVLGKEVTRETKTKRFNFLQKLFALPPGDRLFPAHNTLGFPVFIGKKAPLADRGRNGLRGL